MDDARSEQMSPISTDNADNYFGLAVAFDANLQYKFAVEKYLKAISIDPKHLDARLNLSALYTDRRSLNILVSFKSLRMNQN